ncbi:MAG: hypothetical protein E3J72_07870 [Planctomycetota bacterium]|nr:MAG: hypothetical protein E3J72_07870 [Planctomycetota bacterium]
MVFPKQSTSITACIISFLCGCAPAVVFEETFPTPRQSRHAVSVKLTDSDYGAGIESIVEPPTGIGDAADHYGQLFQLFVLQREELSDRIDPDGQGVAELLRGAECRACTFRGKLTRSCLVPDRTLPVFRILTGYAGAAVERAKKLETDGHIEEAEETLRLVCNFGRHMSRGIENLAFVRAGLRILRDGVKAYHAFAERHGKSDIARECLAYLERLDHAVEIIREKYRALTDFIDFGSLAACLKVAKEDSMPMWRKEACISLALFRFGALRPRGPETVIICNSEMEKKAEEALIEVARTDSDKEVKFFATWCRERIRAADLTSARLGVPPSRPEAGAP